MASSNHGYSFQTNPFCSGLFTLISWVFSTGLFNILNSLYLKNPITAESQNGNSLAFLVEIYTGRHFEVQVVKRYPKFLWRALWPGNTTFWNKKTCTEMISKTSSFYSQKKVRKLQYSSLGNCLNKLKVIPYYTLLYILCMFAFIDMKYTQIILLNENVRS